MSKHRTYPLRFPHTARGIRAQDLRQLNRSSWWARRWMAGLEAMRLGARLGRGRNYAVSGQVVELSRTANALAARVQGSRADAYDVSLAFTSLSEQAAARVVGKLKADPMTLARLLTDDLPVTVEPLFREEGVSLFPAGELPRAADGSRRFDVTMRCSCPDWARPCKHLVAVMLLLGEEVARHPMTLLALRGVDLEELFPRDASDAAADGAPAELVDAPDLPPSAEGVQPIMTRLGPVPFWRSTTRCVDAFGKIFRRATPVARALAQGASIDARRGRI